jgi:hypothetical protein
VLLQHNQHNNKGETMDECPRCRGVGKVNTASEDEATGTKLKGLRELQGVSLRKVASRMVKSPAYLSRLEHGRERWNPELEKNYLKALGVS